MLLAIDTSSLVLSCALAEEDRLIAEWTVQKRLTHSEQLIPHMDEMIKEAGVSKKDITAVAVSIGPGSFTGLRIGLATAKNAVLYMEGPSGWSGHAGSAGLEYGRFPGLYPASSGCPAGQCVCCFIRRF